MSTAIEFDNISKLYRLGLVSTGTLAHDLKRWWTTSVRGKEDPYLRIGETNDRSTKGDSEFVWALKDINFKIEQGDVVGIIGKNGAGKSTLLKLLSKVTAPTTGEIRAKGRIGSLLEVGTGFHPEMTGRENIFMNGAILGMTKPEITRKLDEIVDFSGCERYIDTPVKRYSSGMMVRLGFAVAAHLDPEILVVDEVLAVGDAEFQKKAIGKMQDVSRGEGRTVLFVSHNMIAVRNLCRRGIVMDCGRIIFDGTVDNAIDQYLKEPKKNGGKILDHITQKVSFIEIKEISFNGSENDITTITQNQRYIDISVSGRTDITIFADIAFRISTIDNVPVATFDNGHFRGESEKIEPGDFTIERRIQLPRYLFCGEYKVGITLHQPDITSYFWAPDCVLMYIEGSSSMHGKVLNSKQSGFMGLEIMEP